MTGVQTCALPISIGYEFCYYMTFGLIHFRRALFRRQVSFLAVMLIIALLAGLHMTAYFAIWMLGYAAFRLHHIRRLTLAGWLAIPLAASIVATNHFLVYRHDLRVPEPVSDAIIALLFGAMLLCAYGGRKSLFFGFNAYMADFSYSIYAFHMPIIFFWYSLAPQKLHSSLTAVQSALLVMLLCLVGARILYHASEARRGGYRIAAARVIERIGRLALFRPRAR